MYIRKIMPSTALPNSQLCQDIFINIYFATTFKMHKWLITLGNKIIQKKFLSNISNILREKKSSMSCRFPLFSIHFAIMSISYG